MPEIRKPYFADFVSGMCLVYPVSINTHGRTWEDCWVVINIMRYRNGERTFFLMGEGSRTYTLTAKAEKRVEGCLRLRESYIKLREKYLELLRLADEHKNALEECREFVGGLPSVINWKG